MSPRVGVFLRLFAPLAILLVAGAWLLVSAEYKSEIDRLKSRELLYVSRGATIFDRNLIANTRDAKLLAGDQQLNAYISRPDEKARAALASHLFAFVVAKPIYDEVLLLDRNGREVVRVDFRDGKAGVVPEGRLQSRHDRPYFVDVMQMAAGEVYVSPLELSAEHGEVERPFKPMLRYAVPVLNQFGEKSGVVVLGYRGADLIAQFKHGVGDGVDHLALVNEDGYWLSAANAQDEWGFMFKRPELSMAARHPEAWSRMRGNAHGQFQDGDGLWTFAAVDPQAIAAPFENLSFGRRGSDATEPRYRWYVISLLPVSVLSSAHDYSPAVAGAVVLALLALLGFGISRFQKVVAREAEMNSQFKVFFERAMVGVAKTSPGKRWLMVNPALCRILGYSEEELLQKTWSELTYPDDLGESTASFERVLRDEAEGYTLEKRFVRKGGSIIHTLIAAGCVRKPDRSIDYFIVFIEDITERKLATIRLEDSQAQLRSLSDSLPESYLYQYTLSADGTPAFLYVSSGVTAVHGLQPQAVMESSAEIFSQVHPDDLAPLQAAGSASAKSLSRFFLVVRVLRVDGRWRWLQMRSFPHQTPSGGIVWDGIATDVTEQHENELALQHVSHRIETLLELPKKAETLSDRELMQYAMERAEALTGSQIAFIHLVNDDQETIEFVTWSSSTLAHYCTAVYDRHYPISQAGIWAEAARQHKAVVFNDYVTAGNKRGLPEGHSALTRLMSVPVIEDGKVRMMAGVGNKASDYSQVDLESVQLIANFVWRLVSKRKAELELQVATRVVNASSVVCFRWRAEEGWPVAYVSENVSQWGYSPDSLLDGKPSFSEMVHPDDLAQVMHEVVDYTAAGRSAYFQEYRIVTRDGQMRWVIDETMVIRAADGSVEFYDGVLTDITDRKLTEASLSQSLVEQRALNRKLEEANNQLLQSEKMASIGQLAAGVAHELNNPIGFVHSNLGTLEGYLRDLMFIIESYDKAVAEGGAEAARISMDQIRKERDFDFVRDDIFQLVTESRDGLDRLRRIVLDLKTFSRAGSQDWEYADLNQGLESTLNIVRNELKYKCTVTKQLGELPPVYCQISQINQVFLNLLVNAGQAIDEKDGKMGEITLRTTRLGGEDQVMIEVLDTGKGIPPENLTRIFDPFFTTKPVGKGTGLGLSLSYSIVQAHHGRIEVESQVGQGTTFRVILPIAPMHAPEGALSGKPE